MEILLIVPRYNFTDKVNYNYNSPIGIGYISAALKNGGYSVDCLNLNHFNGKIEEIILRKLDSKSYDIVGTGSNALIFPIIENIIKTIRKHQTAPKIILGGPIITSEPEFMFTQLKPDYAVLGEGEETILDLISCIENKKEVKGVRGIIFWNNEKMIINEKRDSPKNLDNIPFPDFDNLDFKRHLENMHTNEYWRNAFDNPRVYPLLSSRSCPYQCTFCYHDSKYRARSLKNIMEELYENVKKYGINIIIIYDECFAIDKKRIYEFCKRIKKLQKDLSVEIKWLCQLRVENIDREMLSIMKDAGCDVISYGFESYSTEVLKSMRKNITPKQIDEAFKMTIKAGIGVQANFIFGDIAETKETAKKTLDYWKENCFGQVGLGFIVPYPGSEIYKYCIKKRIIKDKLKFIKDEMSDKFFINMTEKMSDEEINELRKQILKLTRKYTKFVRPISLTKTSKDVYSLKVRCPYCKEMIEYKNCQLNPYLYGVRILCRNCKKIFFTVSFIQKVAYDNYALTRGLRDFYVNFIKRLKRNQI